MMFEVSRSLVVYKSWSQACFIKSLWDLFQPSWSWEIQHLRDSFCSSIKLTLYFLTSNGGRECATPLSTCGAVQLVFYWTPTFVFFITFSGVTLFASDLRLVIMHFLWTFTLKFFKVHFKILGQLSKTVYVPSWCQSCGSFWFFGFSRLWARCPVHAQYLSDCQKQLTLWPLVHFNPLTLILQLLASKSGLILVVSLSLM